MPLQSQKQDAEFTLQGLACISCASKIENEVSKVVGIKKASIDFVTASLKIEIEGGHSFKTIQNKITSIIKAIEPDVVLKDHLQHDSDRHHLGEPHLKRRIGRIMLALLFFGVALFSVASLPVKFNLYLVSYVLAGGSVLRNAAKNIARGKVFDENFLMAIATLGAFAIGEYPEGVAVMLFYQIGEFFQSLAVSRSRKSIGELMDIRPDIAHKKQGNQLLSVKPELVNVGDVIVVKPGERIPLDGQVLSGSSFLDTSALTGESVPRKVNEGEHVLSGFINTTGVLEIKVNKSYQDSTVAKVLQLVQEAAAQKAPTENFITKFAGYYTPVVVVFALLLAFVPPLFFPGAELSTWIYRALVFLIISCPCALVVSIPLSFFSGIGSASRHGILVKGGNFLEALHDLEGIAFDKTGTLTEGTFKVTEIHAETLTKDELLEITAYVERYSNHPIAQSIREAYGKQIDTDFIKDYQEIPGQGVQARVNEKLVVAGNATLMATNQIVHSDAPNIGTVIYVAVDQQYVGYIIITDSIKPSSKAGIQALQDLGITNISMVTGDRQNVATHVSEELGIGQVYANLLPQDKINVVEELISSSTGKFAFVGDGINDAPVLARVDLGIAMGGLGSDASIEAADVVLMTDEITQIAKAVKIGRYTRKIVWQNIALALGVKGLFLILGAFGIATLWEAVFADVGVTVIAVINAMRILRKDPA